MVTHLVHSQLLQLEYDKLDTLDIYLEDSCQWSTLKSVSEYNTYSVTLPVSLSSALYLVLGMEYDDYIYETEANNFKSYNYSKTSFKLYIGWTEPQTGNTIKWLCVGK